MHPEPKLAQWAPFSALDRESETRLLDKFSFHTFEKDTLIYTQEISRVPALFVLARGSLRFFHETGGTTCLEGRLGEGDLFGGLSILFNEEMAVHSLESLEKTQVMALAADQFLALCTRNAGFKDHFCLEMGRCMGNRVFADIMAGRVHDRKLNMPFFNQPVSAIYRPNIATCDHADPVSVAVDKMTRNGTSAILVRGADKSIQAIVTDADLKSRLLAPNLPLDTPVSQIASSPIATISSQSQVFEAFLTMIQEDKRHLAVTGNSGDITGIITEKDLIAAQTRATYLLIKSVTSAKGMDALSNIHQRLEKMLLDPISNGSSADYLTRLITAFSDAIIDKAIRFSLEEAGPPPCRFAFLTMGSEGREEQTLISDQDNAIVFEDLGDSDAAKGAKAYFDRLAQGICSRLDLAGYRFCEGNNMAQNPKWCQPLSVWKSYFSKWIRAASPEDLLHSSIFFDFRGTWGDHDLAARLKAHLFSAISKWPGFLRNMTENTLHFKPPITLFGKFVVETRGQYKDALDIKYAILPVIDFVRIYALKNQVGQTNTLARLFRLYTRHALTGREYSDLLQAYNFLMGLRFRRQITTILDENSRPDNYIYPGNLSTLDQIMLKEIFRMIEKLQQKLNLEFTGVV